MTFDYDVVVNIPEKDYLLALKDLASLWATPTWDGDWLPRGINPRHLLAGSLSGKVSNFIQWELDGTLDSILAGEPVTRTLGIVFLEP
ncbi:hypothetical protein LCGC14_2132290 [marine sediment metagenome]|uniref:Uncharacterized protein n=1 Tax=marine sediment metagenome TaxID=412755 RepID=A0A0F9GE03_9ZZZZ